MLKANRMMKWKNRLKREIGERELLKMNLEPISMAIISIVQKLTFSSSKIARYCDDGKERWLSEFEPVINSRFE